MLRCLLIGKCLLNTKPTNPIFIQRQLAIGDNHYYMQPNLATKHIRLVDLGHHLPNANIEQIVSLLLMEGKLGGFHFNDSKYGDDDLNSWKHQTLPALFNF